jgi:RNA polymerase sigma-70 factor, ECF subfamily
MVEPELDTSLDLLGLARRGDPQAWAALYREHEAAVYGFVFRRLAGDRTQADDAFHDTFLKAVERVSQFDPARGTFGAWLTGIARNEVRRRQRSQRSQPGPLPEQVPAQPEGVVGEVHDLVNLAFTALPARYQRALALKYHDGRSLEQVAVELGTTPGAVGSLLHRARAAFRDVYAQHQVEGGAL